jgi:Condensation domain
LANPASQKAIPPSAAVSESDRARLETYLRGMRQTARPAPGSITRRCSTGPVPSSGPQEEILSRSQRSSGEPAFYNEVITIHRRGTLDVTALERSLLEIIRRHEIWRTSFSEANGSFLQTLHPVPTDFRLRFVDLTGFSGPEQESRALECVEELARVPFDLRQGPLLRFLLVRLGESLHRLVVVAHQSIVDGISVYQVLPTELAALYREFSNGNPSPLPEPAIQFRDYALWQRSGENAERIETETCYWRRRLGGELPKLKWPASGPGTKSALRRGRMRPLELTPGVSNALRATAKREGVTLFMTLLSGLIALLRVYTRQTDILVGTLSPAGRKRTELQGLLGYFLNPVMLRFDLSGNPSFRELLQQAREVVSEAISHDRIPFEVLTKKLNLENGADGASPFGVAISLQPRVPETLRPEWDVTSMDAGNGGTVWDLYVAFIDHPDAVIGRVQYNADIFRDETITQMLADLEVLFEKLTSETHARLWDLHKGTMALESGERTR